MTTPPNSRPVFDSYALPLARRREGPAAILSFLAHVTIGVLVLWRGAALFENGGGGGAGPRGGGGGGGRPAMSWVALPMPAAAQPEAATPTPPPAVTVPTVAPSITEPVKLELPPPALTTITPAVVGTGEGTTGGPGQGPGSGGGVGTGTGTGTGSDAGPGSGGNARDIFAPTPRWAIMAPPGAPREARGRHEVHFWVTADGRVTRVEVNPPIKDSGYRREFTERMMGYLFNPATTRDGRHVDYVTSLVVYP
ncbi:MAG TPA: hypothetical protein VMR92_11885 [Gemmatimonadales bacterium]|nr:hypothetical protein [Gemmatimonadales bacterium]